MDKAWQAAVTAAANDPIRLQEVTPEKTAISYYDFMSDDIVTAEADVCSITDGVYTMQYISQVIGQPDENGLYPRISPSTAAAAIWKKDISTTRSEGIL